MEIKGIIFDFFGVIYDDPIEPLLLGLSPDKNEEIKGICERLDVGDIDYENYIHLLAGIVNMSASTVHAYQQNTQPRHTIVKLLKELGQKTSLAVLSNASSQEVRPKLREYELESTFKEVLISAEVGIAKPNPKIFLLCCERLGIAPQYCLFVDDKQENVDTALSVGMKAIRFIDHLKLIADIESCKFVS